MGRKKTANQLYVLTIGSEHWALPPDAPLTTLLDILQRAVPVERKFVGMNELYVFKTEEDYRPRIEMRLVSRSNFRTSADCDEEEDDDPIPARASAHTTGRDLVPARPRANGHATARLFSE